MPYFSKDGRRRLYGYLKKLIQEKNIELIAIGGVEDHVHILVKIHSTHSVAKFVGYLKSFSSKFVKKNGERCNDFAWQKGYGSFSVSSSIVDRVRNYINNQEEHHKKSSFDRELEFFSRL
jgi:REP element-mobilizing transposase RayT